MYYIGVKLKENSGIKQLASDFTAAMRKEEYPNVIDISDNDENFDCKLLVKSIDAILGTKKASTSIEKFQITTSEMKKLIDFTTYPNNDRDTHEGIVTYIIKFANKNVKNNKYKAIDENPSVNIKGISDEETKNFINNVGTKSTILIFGFFPKDTKPPSEIINLINNKFLIHQL